MIADVYPLVADVPFPGTCLQKSGQRVTVCFVRFAAVTANISALFCVDVQASGMLSVPSKHHLAPMLLPVAVEASWRLQRWPLLQDLLDQVSERASYGVCFYRRWSYQGLDRCNLQ